MKLLDRGLPLWVSDIEDDGNPEARLDNNWYSPAAVLAEEQIKKAVRSGRFKELSIVQLCEPDGIATGGSPDEEGDVGLVEGRNLRPNYVLPLFTKFASEPTDVRIGDIVVGKDGEPGTVSVITEALLRYCKSIAVGNHVYHLRLLAHHRELGPFVSAFLNSRIGQALLRKRIAGGTTPTIRKTDIETVPVLIPVDERCPSEIRDAVIQTQERIIESMDNLGPSKNIAGYAGLRDLEVRLPVNWAGGGAQRSSRIIS